MVGAGTFGSLSRPGREAAALLRDAIGRGVGRFAVIVAMSVSTAALESAALVLLPALLGVRFGEGSHRAFTSWAGMGLPGLLALYLGVVGLAAALLYGQTVVASRLTLDFSERLRLRLHAAVLRAGWGTAALARPSDLVHALIGEAAQCANATQTAIQLAARLVYLPSLAGAALFLSPRLAAVALALCVAAGLPMLVLARRAYASAIGMARVGKRLHGDVADDLAGLKIIKAFDAEAARHTAFRERLGEARAASLGQTRATAAVQAWQRLAAAATAALAALYGFAVLHLDGAVMLALTIALARLASTTTQALDLWRQLGRLLPVYGQFRDCEARCLAAAEPAASAAPELRRELRFRSVGFVHPGGSAPTLDGIDLVLPAFSITALTGPSGAGKSTLADLVLGLIAPTSGDILVDGTPLEGPSRVAWRRKVGYVPQEPFLFHASIRANLYVADAEAREADLRRALEAAAATFVERLPEGLDTIVGDRGNRLSGGERQRLMIARALLRAPDLLVLDEATNALDPVSEADVIATLRRLAARTTILVIAHRSSIIAAADRVLHLENGTIALRETTRDPAESAPVAHSTP